MVETGDQPLFDYGAIEGGRRGGFEYTIEHAAVAVVLQQQALPVAIQVDDKIALGVEHQPFRLRRFLDGRNMNMVCRSGKRTGIISGGFGDQGC